MERLRRRLFAPTDVASLVYFRIVFGAIMLWEVSRYFDNNWITYYWVEPKTYFPYYGFGWLRPWPGVGMYLHFFVLGVLAVSILLGFFYRVSITLFFLGFSYVFLLEQSQYLNHFYLVCLVAFLMIFVPAHRAFSLDVLRRPSLASSTVPAWTVVLLPAQMAIVYFYGGLAKLNGDWLRGEPMRTWLSRRTDFPLIGALFTEEWMVYLFAYGGLLFDLFIVFFLVSKRTRLFALVAAALFHTLNARLFGIGIFPWFGLAITLLFFPPDWPRRLLGLQRVVADDPQSESAGSARFAPRQRLAAGLLGLYFAVQLLLPLRHFAYPGNVSWTEEGHNFSWHMKLREKGSTAKFFVTDPVQNTTREVQLRKYLASHQQDKMATRPDMLLQFSHHLAETLRRQGHEKVEVRAKVMASLNGRKQQLLIDPEVDLAAQPRSLKPKPWIMPLLEPLLVQTSRTTE